MGISTWGGTEWGLFTFNFIAVAVIIWALRKKVLSKLAEVEERQTNIAKRRRKGLHVIEDE
jgi:cbb3-type cytochrome oxidase subunit 3